MQNRTRTRCSTCRDDAAGMLQFWGAAGHLLTPSCMSCASDALIFSKCSVRWIPSRQPVGGAL